MENLGIQEFPAALGLKALQENPDHKTHLAPQGNIIRRHIMSPLHRHQLPLENAGAIVVADADAAVQVPMHHFLLVLAESHHERPLGLPDVGLMTFFTL